MKMSLRILGIILFLLAQLLASGCSKFSMPDVHALLEAGNPEAAFAYMAKKAPNEDSFSRREFAIKSGLLFERGLVAHYAKRFLESNKAFALTEVLSEGYTGTQFERLLRQYYRILNYIYLNQLEKALVECRRAMALIDDSKGGNEDYAFLGSGLLAHLSGMCFEAANEWDDAFISYQQAETFYQKAALKTEIKIPADVGKALVRLARRLNRPNEASHYQRQYGEPDAHPNGTGELILFYESGYVPAKDQAELSFPILKTDTGHKAFREDNRDDRVIAQSFVMDTLLVREGQFYSNMVLEYVLSIPMPIRSANRPHLAGIVVQANTIQQNGVLVGDIQTMAIEDLNAKLRPLLVRSLTDFFLQYLTYRVEKPNAERRRANAERRRKYYEEEKKEIMQDKDLSPADKLKLLEMLKLANTVEGGFGTTTVRAPFMRADTRYWRTLPNQIFLVRMRLPEGTHNITLSFLDASGKNREAQILQDVEISSNQLTFLNYRTYK